MLVYALRGIRAQQRQRRAGRGSGEPEVSGNAREIAALVVQEEEGASALQASATRAAAGAKTVDVLVCGLYGMY